MAIDALCSDLTAPWTGVRSGRLASVAAIVALARGSAAGISASAIAYSGLIRPIPLPDAGRLVVLKRVLTLTGGSTGIRLNDFDRWRTEVSATLDLAAYASDRTTVRDAAGAKEIQA